MASYGSALLHIFGIGKEICLISFKRSSKGLKLEFRVPWCRHRVYSAAFLPPPFRIIPAKLPILHAARRAFETATVLLTFVNLSSYAEGGVLFSSLDENLVVTADIPGQNNTDGPRIRTARVGEDHLIIKWALNSTLSGLGIDKIYMTVNIRLCFAPISQVERGWRKTNDDLHKDKTCSIAIASQKYSTDGNVTDWIIRKNVPGATYFVRAYVTDVDGMQLAYGQTTDNLKTSNLIVIEPITGRHVSIDIASAIFSIASVGALVGFLIGEFRKMK
ncbi:hypothetical protein R1sor_016098 [Riccia sorocarpa]|uniref:High-affinity nitrate transporter n=1 Tax=Riccia sorocarpa TaxID=122646 RepID=A0ABD3HH64_9MARC